MTTPIYPSQIYGITPNVLKTPEFNSLVSASSGKAEVRISQMRNPIWNFQLSYEQLFNDTRNPAYAVSELDTLMGLFLAASGQFGEMLFDDPEDDTVTNQALSLVNDGAGSPTYYTPLQRNKGGFLEDITDLNPLNGSGLTVKANGVAQVIGTASVGGSGACGGGGVTCELHGPGLAIPGYSFTGMYLKWCAAPTPPITASFGFYFRVRFAEDKQDFEKFLYQLWTIGGAEGKNGSGFVKLVTARPVQV